MLKIIFESPNDLNYIAAKSQFYNQLQEKMISGEFIQIDNVENDYECIMNQYNLSYVKYWSALTEKNIAKHF